MDNDFWKGLCFALVLRDKGEILLFEGQIDQALKEVAKGRQLMVEEKDGNLLLTVVSASVAEKVKANRPDAFEA